MPENYIGVDVAKDWIDVHHPETGATRRIYQDGFRTFARDNSDALLVLEASGGYERPLLRALEAAGTRYVRVNPRHAREFARATGTLAKTDRVDARLLALMGQALKLTPDTPRCAKRERLAALTARRDGLIGHLKKEKTRLKQADDAYVRKDITSFIGLLERRIKKIETEIESLIASEPTLSRLSSQLLSVPGIGKVTSAILIAKLPELGQVNRRAIASLAGLAPHAHDSGYMRGKRRIWGGRKEVRSAMYIAAFIASRYDPELKAERSRMISDGKPYKLTLIALARRLLTRLNAIVREDRSYVC